MALTSQAATTVLKLNSDKSAVFEGGASIATHSSIGSTSLAASNTYVLDVKKAYSSTNGHVAYFGAGTNTASKVGYDTVVVAQDDVTCLAIVEGNAANTNASEQALRLAVGDNSAVISSTSTASNGMYFYTNRATSTYGYQINEGTRALHLANTGNATFGYDVDVDGDITLTGSSKNIVLNYNNEIRTKDSGGTDRTVLRAASNKLQYGWSYSGKVEFMGGGAYSPKITIDTNGKVGIGTARGGTDPDEQLHVAGENSGYDGTLKVGERAIFAHRDAGQTKTFLANNYNSDSATFGIRMKGVADSDEVMTITGAGNTTFAGTVSAHGNSDTTPAFEMYSDSNHGMRILHRGTDGDFSFERRLNGTNTEFLRISRATGAATFAGTIASGAITATGGSDQTVIDADIAFDLTDGSKDTLLITNNKTTSAIGAIGPSIGFGNMNSDRRTSAIGAIRTGGDHDQMGLAFFTHPATGNDDTVVKQLELAHDGKATFEGNVELGDSSNISMSTGGAGQLQVQGSGYTGAIALNATAMYIYHNSSIRDLVLGTNETARLTIAGNSGNTSITGTFTAAGDVVAFSDERLKSNIETLDGSKVYDMRGVSFTKDNKDSSGVIAQELEKVAPELVNNDGEYKSVAYGNITGYLIEAIKDLKAEIEELKKCECKNCNCK